MKFLNSKDFYLKKLSKEDNFTNYLEMINEVEELKYMDDLGRYPLNREDVLQYLENVSGLFLSIFTQNNKHIGNIRISGFHEVNRHCHFGILIHKRYRNQGFAYKASKLILEHLFNNLNMNRVELYVFSENDPAKHLYKKLGFIEEGIKREVVWKSGYYHDLIVYSMLKKDYVNDE